MKRKGLAIAGLVAGLSVLSSMTAFAGEWKQDSNGWWWQNDDGSYPVSTWQWIDGNKDGLSESYYFNEAGYLVTNTTIDGYTVNADGAWTVDGQIQTMQTSLTDSSIRAVDAEKAKGTYKLVKYSKNGVEQSVDSLNYKLSTSTNGGISWMADDLSASMYHCPFLEMNKWEFMGGLDFAHLSGGVLTLIDEETVEITGYANIYWDPSEPPIGQDQISCIFKRIKAW